MRQFKIIDFSNLTIKTDWISYDLIDIDFFSFSRSSWYEEDIKCTLVIHWLKEKVERDVMAFITKKSLKIPKGNQNP